MTSYGDHSYDHDHGPMGYWDGREDEQRAYEEGYRKRQQAHADKRADFLAMGELRRKEAGRAEEEERQKQYAAACQEKADQKVAAMTDLQIIQELVSGFGADARSFGSQGVRSSIDRYYYNALRRRYLDGGK